MKNYFVDITISENLWHTALTNFATKKARIKKDYDDTILPPQTPTVEALKTDFDRPITNLIDKANNIIEMVPKTKN